MKKLSKGARKGLDKRMKEVEKGFGITKDEKKRAVACDYVIDTNKRKGMNDEPKLID